MSFESDAQKMKGRDIPNKRVVLNDISQLPSEYSTTPGGTFFSTTPGGMSLITRVCIVHRHAWSINYIAYVMFRCFSFAEIDADRDVSEPQIFDSTWRSPRYSGLTM